jgi:signal transduction histidine kinase
LLLSNIENQKEAMAIAFVLRKSNGRSLWLFVDARALFRAVLQSGRSGTTGEIYAVDRNGLMISDSRFNTHLYEIGLLQPGQESAMRVSVRDPMINLLQNKLPPLKDRMNWPLTKMVASVVKQERSIDLGGYRDYRGVPVVGAWLWLDEFNFALTHEIDYAEAFSHVSALEIVVASLVFALFIATIIASLSSIRVTQAERLEKKSQERLKELQTQIAQVNRLATMGELATGLAHEINQPLMAVSNYARAALNELDGSNTIDHKKLRERLSSVEKNALRAGEVIRRIRKFVSRGEIQAGVVNFDQLIKYPLEILANEIKASAVKISLKVPKNLPMLWLDEIQIQQVFVNLIRNAIEAIQRAKSVKREINIEVNIDEDQYVCISIRDSGPGISAEVRERLFEQFNSSNPNGMGLGLAISRRIIEAHQGVIDVESSPENGVHFLIRIPVQAHSEHQSA